MRIDFFEEYPAECLEIAARLPFPSTIYIAAHSVGEFFEYRDKLKVINPNCEAAYWPLLPHSYWVSPLSFPQELETIIAELEGCTDESFPVLIDLELPILQKHLFLKNCKHFFSNKRRIKRLLTLPQRTKLSIRTAEYWYSVGWAKFLTQLAGVSYPKLTDHTPLIMWYPSILRALDKNLLSTDNYMRKYLSKALARRNVELAYGALSIGVFEKEPIVTPEALRKDLYFMKNAGATRITIFRLEGVTDKMLEILEPYAREES